MRKLAIFLTLTSLTISGVGWGEDEIAISGWKLAMARGLEAHLQQSESGMQGLQLSFRKRGEERRLLALEAAQTIDLSRYKTMLLRYRLHLASGQAPRLAVVVFSQDGSRWFKVRSTPLSAGKLTEARLPLASFQQWALSDKDRESSDWQQVAKMWIGWVFDGPADGSIDIFGVSLTSTGYRPTTPLTITGADAGQWSVGQDPAVRSHLTTPNEGPDGRPCMKFEFTFPGGRHMYATPFTPVPSGETEGYRALRFTYKATLPAGIPGLLVMLGEGGAQFFADPPPPPSNDWVTITLPFEQFKLGSWSKDDNGRLDLDKVDRVYIAVHGTASGKGGEGTIWVTDIQFVP